MGSRPADDSARTVQYLVAPDKFKGSLDAAAVARRLAVGLTRGVPSARCRVIPMADGGEGTVDAAVAAGYRRETVTVSGPTGHPVSAAFAVRGTRAVIELAAASGLTLLPGGRPAPLSATTVGTGQLVRAALDLRCRDIVLGVGGSAGTDGGTGLVVALGARLLDAAGNIVRPGSGLHRVHTVDLTGLDRRLSATRVVLATDVDNPLLGPYGAAAVYGPQKGAGPTDVAALEAGLRAWVAALGDALGRGAAELADAPGAGAAGGTGYAAMAVLGAERRAGVAEVIELTGLAGAAAAADLVITGEGSIDRQTLRGKTPAGVAAVAKMSGRPVVAVCGRLDVPGSDLPALLRDLGIDAVYPLSDLEPDLNRSMAGAAGLLEQVGERIAADFSPGLRP